MLSLCGLLAFSFTSGEKIVALVPPAFEPSEKMKNAYKGASADFRSSVQSTARQFLNMVDTDQDDAISPQEAQNFLVQHGNEVTGRLLSNFEGVDLDHDGEVNLQELVSGILADAEQGALQSGQAGEHSVKHKEILKNSGQYVSFHAHTGTFQGPAFLADASSGAHDNVDGAGGAGSGADGSASSSRVAQKPKIPESPALQILTDADKNKDGFVSQPELISFAVHRSFLTDLVTHFDQYDLDGKGLDEPEIAAFLKQRN